MKINNIFKKNLDLTKDNPKYYKNHGDALRAMADLYLADKEYSKAKEYIEKSYIYLNKDATTPQITFGVVITTFHQKSIKP